MIGGVYLLVVHDAKWCLKCVEIIDAETRQKIDPHDPAFELRPWVDIASNLGCHYVVFAWLK